MMLNATFSFLVQDLLHDTKPYFDIYTVHVIIMFAATVVMRTVMFPVFVIGRRGMINYSNCQPKVLELQRKMQMASAQGDSYRGSLLKHGNDSIMQ